MNSDLSIKKKFRYDEDFKKKMVDLYKNGYSLRRIYSTHGVSRCSMHIWCQKYMNKKEIEQYFPKKKKLDQNEIMNFVKENPYLNLMDYSMHFNCCETYLSVVFKKMGIVRVTKYEYRPYAR